MVQSFNNQVMFGHREWAILAENNKPMPVGLDNKPMVDKPLQKQLREPSEVEEEKTDDSIRSISIEDTRRRFLANSFYSNVLAFRDQIISFTKGNESIIDKRYFIY